MCVKNGHLYLVSAAAVLLSVGYCESDNIAKIGKAAKVVEVTNARRTENASELFVGDIGSASVRDGLEKLEYDTVMSQNFSYAMEKLSSMEWLLNLYNPHLLHNISSVGKECEDQMDTYLSALQAGAPWAAKMTDASGRYSSQFFFGNNYWLGSESLCFELTRSPTNKQNPPFPVNFRVARLRIKLSDVLTPQGRIIYLGLCLPKSCTNPDTAAILTSRLNSTVGKESSMSVLNVRSVPGSYSLMRDAKFHALGGSMLVVLLMMIVGTFFDYFTKNKNSKDDPAHRQQNGFDKNKTDANDVENNNSEKKSAFDFKSKANIYEVTKKENLDGENKARLEKSEAKETRKGFVSEMLLSFSVLTNAQKILDCSKISEDSLTSVHGLRFLSLAWVILVHTYLQLFAIGGNKTIRTVTERSFMYQTIGNATFSVDSFFFISGLLISYLYFKNDSGRSSDRDSNVKVIAGKFLTLILYRFVRLTPVYIVVLGMIQLSMTFINNTSVFEPAILDHLNCESYWWRNILYVNNMFPRKEMCMLWSWYMATDMQFFVLSALLLLLAKKHFKFSAATLSVVLVSSWCTTAFISYTNQYEAKVQEPFVLFDELYDKPWTRIGPYIVGMCAGWLLYQTDCKIKMSIPMVVLGWASSFACLLSLVYGVGNGIGVASSTVYVALGHTAWGLSLGWIVVACRSGYGGWVNSFLSCSALYPLSRLTYCAYLVHPLIMVLTSYVMDGSFHIHNGLIVIIYLGNVVASFLLSFLLSLAFEAPVVRLLKLIMTPSNKR